MKKILIICIGILVIFAIGALAIWLTSRQSLAPAESGPTATSTPAATSTSAATSVEKEIYRSEKYSYSFTYPANLSLQEYQPFAIVVGERSGTGIVPFAEADVAESDGEGGYQSFDAYVFEHGRQFCAADGPYESISCDRVISTEPFTTSSGVVGKKIMFHLIHRNFATNTDTESEFGPVYAFDMRGRIADSDFSALFVRPSLGTSDGGAHADLISSIAKSLTFSP